jgi:hypothetical protein
MKKTEGKSKGVASKVTATKKATVKTAKSKKASSVNKLHDHETIRAKAEEIYHKRIAKGEWGTPEGDWHAAEEYLSKR